MDRDEALAICLANLKGPKDKDLLSTAKALQYLKALPEYGSNAKVGEAVGVSGEIVREFLTLLKLPCQTQELFEHGQLRLEQGRRLWQLARLRPELLEETAEAMADLTAIDSRHLVEYILEHPELPVSESKKRVLESKAVVQREFHVIAILTEEEYNQLDYEARKQKVAIDVLVSFIVRQWLQSGKSND